MNVLISTFISSHALTFVGYIFSSFVSVFITFTFIACEFKFVSNACCVLSLGVAHNKLLEELSNLFSLEWITNCLFSGFGINNFPTNTCKSFLGTSFPIYTDLYPFLSILPSTIEPNTFFSLPLFEIK